MALITVSTCSLFGRMVYSDLHYRSSIEPCGRCNGTPRLALAELLKSDVTTILKLPPIVEFVLQAVRLGGSIEQKTLVEAKFSKRMQSLRHAEDSTNGRPSRAQLAFFDFDPRKRKRHTE